MDQLERGGGMYKKVLSITVGLLLLQLLRMGAKGLVFQVLERTIWTDEFVSSLYMLAATGMFLAAARKRRIKLHLFPATFSCGYKIGTMAVLAFFAATPIITQSVSPAGLVSLVYHAVITVVFEEVLFRGFVYQAVKRNGLHGACPRSFLGYGTWAMLTPCFGGHHSFFRRRIWFKSCSGRS